jgi:SAM-dependent methyltransferase
MTTASETLVECRVCDSPRLEPVIDLGNQPWCNCFLKKEEIGQEPVYPLRVVYCHGCGITQLDTTVRKEVMFTDHTYLSGVTRSLSDHFGRVAADVDERFFKGVPFKSVLDIGSNDGTQLKHFQKLGYDVLGVESSKTVARLAVEAGVPTRHQFFNLQTMGQIGRKFDVINAAGVFFHLEELHSVTEGIREGLTDGGVFIVQFLYIKDIVNNGAFDQIYHEHLIYYSLRTLERLLERHGLEMFDAYRSPIHGGSIIGFVSHNGKRERSQRFQDMARAEDDEGVNRVERYHDFFQRIQRMKNENVTFLQKARESGKRVFGLGAPAKGNTLLNYFGVGPQLMECLVEKNELRRGLYSPGMHIPIVIEKERIDVPDIYYVLAWNFKQEILANHKPLLERGVEFYFPVDPQ